MSKRWPNKTVIGLTGNIATGKSVVRRMLEHLGAFGIDADGLSHRATAPGAPAYFPTVETFGKYVLDPDGRINRKRLGRITFGDPAAMAMLEKIVHPIVIEVIGILIKRAPQDVVVVEAIALIESGLADACDSIWVVDTPAEVQIKRLVETRSLSEEEAKLRISAQNAQSGKLARADVIIHNADGYEKTLAQVQKELGKLTGIAETPDEDEPVVSVAATTPAPAPAEDKPAAVLVPSAARSGPLTGDIKVRRSGPKDAQMIAEYLNQRNGTKLSRTDILASFGDKAYMLAYVGDTLAGVIGWQVENLITRVPQLDFVDGTPIDPVIKAVVHAIETASGALQSEVNLIFLPEDGSDEIRKTLINVGYEQQESSDFRIPDWREAAEESAPTDTYMMVRRLRTDRILKPI